MRNAAACISHSLWVHRCLQNDAEDMQESQRWTTVELVLMGAVVLLLLPLLYAWRAYRTAKASAVAAVPAAAGSPAKPSKKAKSKKSKSSNKAAAADAEAEAAELQQLTATAVNGLEPGFDPVASSPPAISSSGDIERSSSEMQALLAAGQALHAGSGQVSRAASAAGSVMGIGSPLRSPTPSDPGAISPVPDGASSGNTPGMMTTRSYVDEDGAVVIGRLRVGPGILGYGSAGEALAGGNWYRLHAKCKACRGWRCHRQTCDPMLFSLLDAQFQSRRD
jgi:hypothetical protein